jgi:hypothetical protein
MPRAMNCLCRLSFALGATAIACFDSSGPIAAGIVPFDATVQPVLTATSAATGAAGRETVRVTVVMTNPDAYSRQFTFHQPCLLSLRLYDTPARTGTPAYQDGLWPGGCKSLLYTDTLAAHANVTYSSTSNLDVYSPPAPNAQRLPPDRYYGTVSVSVVELTSNARTLPVGEVVVAVP